MERGLATAIIGVPMLLAPAFGPTIGGYLSATFNWNAIFSVNLPIGIAAFTLALFVLHGRAQEREANGEMQADQKQFDAPGLLLSMIGFTALVYGITEAGSHGWGRGRLSPASSMPTRHPIMNGLVSFRSHYGVEAGCSLAPTSSSENFSRARATGMLPMSRSPKVTNSIDQAIWVGKPAT